MTSTTGNILWMLSLNVGIVLQLKALQIVWLKFQLVGWIQIQKRESLLHFGFSNSKFNAVFSNCFRSSFDESEGEKRVSSLPVLKLLDQHSVEFFPGKC